MGGCARACERGEARGSARASAQDTAEHARKPPPSRRCGRLRGARAARGACAHFWRSRHSTVPLRGGGGGGSTPLGRPWRRPSPRLALQCLCRGVSRIGGAGTHRRGLSARGSRPPCDCHSLRPVTGRAPPRAREAAARRRRRRSRSCQRATSHGARVTRKPHAPAQRERGARREAADALHVARSNALGRGGAAGWATRQAPRQRFHDACPPPEPAPPGAAASHGAASHPQGTRWMRSRSSCRRSWTPPSPRRRAPRGLAPRRCPRTRLRAAEQSPPRRCTRCWGAGR